MLKEGTEGGGFMLKRYWGIIIGTVLLVWLAMPKIDLADGTPIPFWLFPPRVILLHTMYTISPSLAPFTEALIFLLFGVWIYFGIRTVRKPDVLKHPGRAALLSLIGEDPGLSFADLVRVSGMNRGTLSYHLGKLAWAGRITRRRIGGITRYYENHDRYGEREQHVLARMKGKTESEIVTLVLEEPGIGRAGLADKTGLTGPAITWHMNRLRQDDIVVRKRNGRKTEYYINPEIMPFLVQCRDRSST